MRIITAVSVPLFAAALVAAGAAPANAEGRPEQGPQHANSICSFSGLNDGTDGRTQSYGQLVKGGLPAHLVRNGGPGTSCNGHLHPWPENPPQEP